VLVVPGASTFRNADFDHTLGLLKSFLTDPTGPKVRLLAGVKSTFKSTADIEYSTSLANVLRKMEDFESRVEGSWISIYCNSKKQIDNLIKLDEDRVKYVCVPPSTSSLESGTIILPKVDYEFKVTLGKSTSPNTAFVEWAETNSKVKLTKSCIRELNRNLSWGGSYFYITGEKNLLVAKMHLGSVINKVERIVKS
jgi:hypothetical protein